MKLRVKLNGQSRLIDLGDTDVAEVTLTDLKASVSDTFSLDNNRNVDLSLNKKDVLVGDETALADLGIVPGDLIHIITNDLPNISPPSRRQQPLPSHSNGSKVVVLDRNQHSQPNDDRNKPGSVNTPFIKTSTHSSSDPSTSCGSHSIQEDDRGVMEIGPQEELVKRDIQEPLVIGESSSNKVPIILKELYSNFEITIPNDALFVLLHGLMLESGFSLPENADISSVPSGWKKPGFYVTNYEYVLKPDVVLDCSLMAVPTGSFMAIHGLSKTVGDFKTDHLQLKSENYVRDISQADAASAFRSLDRLSNLFKDNICLTLQNHLATSAGFREMQGLFSLPCEVRMRLLCFLDAKSICNLGQTCQQWRAIYKDNSVWRRLYLQSFECPEDNSLSRNWHELFKVRYNSFKEEQERRRQFLWAMEEDFHFPRPPMGPFNPLHPLPPPRFLGGDHDLNPEFASGIPDLLNDRRGIADHRGLQTFQDPFSSGGPFHRGRGRGRGNLTGSPFIRRGPFM